MPCKKKLTFEHVVKLVVSALRELKDPKGSSLVEIKNHMNNYGKPNTAILSQVPDALKRGINFGAIKKRNGHYKLDSLMALSARNRRHPLRNGVVGQRRKSKSNIKKKKA